MGRSRKSIEELKRSGTFRPSRHGSREVVAQPGPDEELVERIERPAELDADAVAIWCDLIELLRGSIRRRDVPALKELCRWMARSDRIAAELDHLNPTDKAFKGLLVAAGIATDKVSDLTKRFGISPADRLKLRADSPAGPAKPKVATRPATKLDRAGPPKPAAKPKGKR